MSNKKAKLKIAERVLSQNKVSKLNDLKIKLKTNSSVTVYRIINSIGYYSSSSHNGRYYTSKMTPVFNEFGIWFYKSILFSSHGNLYNTLEYIISNSEKGYSSTELEELLKVTPNLGLLKLIKEEKIVRNKQNGIFIYYSVDKRVRERQKLFNKTKTEQIKLLYPNQFTDELKASMILFYCTLNEKQRRLYAGTESLKIGVNGDRFISELLQMNIKTVAKGRHELIDETIADGVRQNGGGRKKKRTKSQN